MSGLWGKLEWGEEGNKYCPLEHRATVVVGVEGRPRLADERGHLFPKGMIFEVSELACIKIHAVFSTDRVTDGRLINILHVLHLLSPDRSS